MKAVVGVLVMLLKVCHGVEINCDGRQDGAQCYGPLRGTVVLQLIDNFSEIHFFRWLNKTDLKLFNKGNTILTNNMEKRSSYSAGTFTINNLSRSDEGRYTLEILNSNGDLLKKRSLQLTIQAPVSSVLLDSECLSHREMRVSCSSEEGDSPHYNWTLNGHTLTDAQLLSGNNTTNNITLKQDVSGLLVCSVSNNVGSESSKKGIETCDFIFINCTLSNGSRILRWVQLEAKNALCIESTTTTIEGKLTGITVSDKPSNNITSSNQPSSITDAPWYRNWVILAGVLSALVILLVAGIAFICAHKKTTNNKEEKEEPELMYANVEIMQLQGRQTAQRAEMEVEYSQVKLSDQLGQTAERNADDFVYSKVRKAR